MRKLFYTALILPVALLAACADWLDVKPEASVSVEELFNSEEGFCEAVNGLYINASNYFYYGGVATMELMDAMMQNYSFDTEDYTDYAETAAFDITHAMFKNRLAFLWSNAYNAIVNCNLILENIDSRKNLFNVGMYEIVKGEALALRAYFHFDMLRLFCVPYTVSSTKKAIPYVTTYSNKVTPISTAEEVMGFILKDLNDAKLLLADHDPILDPAYVVGYPSQDKSLNEPEATEQKNTNLFLQNRRHRMNYYAVCGTLARVYLWKGATADAYANAEEVYNSGKFWYVNAESFVNKDYKTKDRDRIMYPELVFAWYNEKNIEELKKRYDEDLVKGYYINPSHLQAIYEVGGIGDTDRRYKAWFIQPQEGNPDFKMQFIKYLRNPSEIGNKHPMMAPAIRLSEMAFIMAEHLAQTNEEAAKALLNEVRTQRDISLFASNPFDFKAELLKEYRKETFGEGQAFFAYKRLGAAIVPEDGTGALPYTPDKFSEFPLPDDELEFREK